MDKQTSSDSPRTAGRVKTSVLYGIITSMMLLPVEISFCSIIFHHDAFSPNLPQLIKLVMFSCAVHQLCFTLTSSLPFAVGQVQDAGLIFLSAMAADIAVSCKNSADIIPTTLVILSTCTALLGLMLIVVSKLKLASLVQYLPMPVIGGYLAFIGFYCGIAGITMMAGVERITSIFSSSDHIALAAPGIFSGIGMYVALRNIASPFVLPCSFAIILLVFYGTMAAVGMSFEEARYRGWIAPLAPAASALESWSLFDFGRVEWELLPNQFFRLLGMFFVVAFSSTLDVAAIEMELGMPLDYNGELSTVGISNFISGLCGGYSGSYIFSPTILQLKAGVDLRLSGCIIILMELIVVFIPVSLTSYIPKLFFGSLLVLIAVDLMFDWLVAARKKMMLSEYIVCLLTFVAILIFGIEGGMLVGVLSAMFSFIVHYSKLQSVSAFMLRTSTVVRTFEDRALLAASRGRIVTVSFDGYIFFGTAVKVLEEIKSKLVVSGEDVEINDSIDRHSKKPGGGINWRKKPLSLLFSSSPMLIAGKQSFQNMIARYRQLRRDQSLSKINQAFGYDELLNEGEEKPFEMVKRTQIEQLSDVQSSRSVSNNGNHSRVDLVFASPSASSLRPVVRFAETGKEYSSCSIASDDYTHSILHSAPYSNIKGTLSSTGQSAASSDMRSCRNDDGKISTEFLILDFAEVIGIDATAARSCFLTLVNLMKTAHVTIVFANLSAPVYELLKAHHVIDEEESIVIPTLDDALEWCEDQVLLRCRHMMEYSSSSAAPSLKPNKYHLAEKEGNHIVSPIHSSYPQQNLDQKSTRGDMDQKDRMAGQPARTLKSILEEYLGFDHFGTVEDAISDHNAVESIVPQSSETIDSLLSNEDILARYFQREVFGQGQIIFDIDDYADKIYFIAAGIVEVVTMPAAVLEESRYLLERNTVDMTLNRKYHDENAVIRVNKVSAGGVCGECDFFLDRNHSVRAYTVKPTICWSLQKSKLNEMQRLHPQLCSIIQYTLLKSLALSATCALYSLHPLTAYDSADIV